MNELLSISGGIRMKECELLCIIMNPDEEKYFSKVLKKAKYKIIMNGIGTASSSLLEYFGLSEEDKKIVLSIVPKILAKNILHDIKQDLEEPGTGIAFSIPVTSSVKYISDSYKLRNMEDIVMEKACEHLIITIANEGYSQDIMKAAKKGGATGGTLINGRGLDTEKMIKFLGITIEQEKDVVLIIAEDKKRTDIMNAIVHECGIKSAGAGICFSIPVDYVVGLNKHILEN